MKYAGIGSRDTPDYILNQMKDIATSMEKAGWLLRSGHADGADKAFESGVKDYREKEIFTAANFIPEWAFETVDKYHPAPDRLSTYARRLHARNAMIVLGSKGDEPVDLIICWTQGGKLKGGTAQALRIADDYDIPVINLGVEG